MNAIERMTDKGYEFKLEGKNIKYNFKGEGGANKNEIINDLLEIKKYKKWAIDYLSNQTDKDIDIYSVDIETTSLKPSEGEIVLVGYANKEGSNVVTNVEEIKDILENKKTLKVFHNAAFDVYWLESKGYKVENYTDTMIMSLVINNRVKQENSLADLAQKYLNIIMDKTLQSEGNWKGQITQKHMDYCKKDAEITYKLYSILMNEIARLHLDGVLRREINALPAVIELKRNGIKFNYSDWESVLKEYEEEKDSLEIDIKEILKNQDINLNSPKQLLQALKGLGIDITSTADEVLAKYEGDYKIIKLLRKYKKLKKKLTSFGHRLKEKIDSDNRIRANWKIIGADTSRMTCTSPNLQGMPSASKKYFIPKEGHVFVIADYSQIELRVLAQISDDPIMIKAFKDGEDLHTKTASMILGKPISDITASERKIAKTANFGLIYGMTSFGLRKRIRAQYDMDVSLDETELFRNGYFNSYKQVLKYQDKMLKSEHIQTLGGRYWAKETYKLEEGSIKRYNYPIQGTAAEGFKEALGLIMNQKESNWKLVAVVHDEIVLEVPRFEANNARDMLYNCMKNGMEKLIDKVPIEIDMVISNCWDKP